jgi:hypothetical protein
VVLKSKRAAATALLSGESQVGFVIELQEFYKNSVSEFWSGFSKGFQGICCLRREKKSHPNSGWLLSLANDFGVACFADEMFPLAKGYQFMIPPALLE